MIELYQESIRLINFPFTLVLLVVFVYWLLVLVGMLDHEFLDFGAGLDAQGGGHANGAGHGHLDGHADGHTDSHHGFLGMIGRMLHVGDAPTTVILSLLAIFMWSFSLIVNYSFNKGDSLLLGLAYLIPNFAISITLTGVAVIPSAMVFRKLSGNEVVKKDAVGEICEVITSKVDSTSGQAAVETGGAPITVSARTASAEETLAKGQKAVVVRKNDDGTYIIKALEESL